MSGNSEDNKKQVEKQNKEQVEISLTPIVINSRLQYEYITNLIFYWYKLNVYAIPTYQNVNQASEFINNFLYKKVNNDDGILEDLLKKLKSYNYYCYVNEDDYEWLIRDKQTCYFGWLYLKTLYIKYKDLDVLNSILSTKIDKKTNGHGLRQKILITYFSTVFYGYNHGLLHKDDNDNIKEYPLKNKRHFIDDALCIWGKYYKMPNQFKWLKNDPSGDTHKLIWNQLCTTVPFLQRNEDNKQLEINKQNRLGIKEPRPVKMWENDFAIELIITDLEEMELSIHASYCVWVGVCLSNNYEHKDVIAFRKKISDALYAKKRKYKRLNSKSFMKSVDYFKLR